MFRWFALAVFLVSLGISARRRRQARRAGETIRRSQEPPGLIAGRMLVALPLFSGVLVYLANPEWMAWASLDLPTWVRWVGVGLGVIVPISVHRVLAALGANVSETVLTKRHHRLVTSGPYGRVRHPLYATGLALFLSMGLMAANAFILLWTAVASIGVRVVVIPREEAHLEATFGERYRRYRRETGSLLPRLPGVGAGRRAG